MDATRMLRLGLAMIGFALCLIPGTGARGEADPPLEQGYTSKAPPERGIVLSLHGCAVFPAVDWNEYFERNGYKLFVPDSFAETRPTAACAYPYADLEQIIELRLRQAVRSLRILKQRYPDEPIILWGHGEGGSVALSLDVPVSSVIITGHHCDLEDDKPVRTSPDIPMLVMQGDQISDIDQTFNISLFSTPEERCEKALTSPLWRYVIISGEGQPPRLIRADAKKALQRFLELNSLENRSTTVD